MNREALNGAKALVGSEIECAVEKLQEKYNEWNNIYDGQDPPAPFLRRTFHYEAHLIYDGEGLEAKAEEVYTGLKNQIKESFENKEICGFDFVANKDDLRSMICFGNHLWFDYVGKKGGKKEQLIADIKVSSDYFALFRDFCLYLEPLLKKICGEKEANLIDNKCKIKFEFRYSS